MISARWSCWNHTQLLISSFLCLGLLIINVTINDGLSSLVEANSDLIVSASGWGQSMVPSSSPTCHCPPRPVKYVAIEIPKIIKVPAPAPPAMMMPPISSPPKQTIIPITIPLLTHVPASAPAPSPMVPPSSLPPSSDTWSISSNPWSN
ncbi:uncharacterized protein LOC128394162 [Panonychus citri]|uniref:uncharacterized protein LOC128394162 n=1 Tax=Panonychus citri TaxID=50023 RepID=UPI00230797F4|nr:uncharacterized protein LOC128394162 [Panonychus citri]